MHPTISANCSAGRNGPALSCTRNAQGPCTTVTAVNAGFRVTRRVFLAVVVVTLSLAGHAAGSAMLPSLEGFGLAVLLASALTVAVKPGVSAVRLLAILLGVQALLHAVFVLSSDCIPASGSPMSLVPSGVTVVGHVVASIVAVAILRRGDELLSRWTALLAAAFATPETALAPIPVRLQIRATVWEARHFGADGHFFSQVRRGPPSA